jgi:HTH-type transcriptional regulator / antitoxin HigA
MSDPVADPVPAGQILAGEIEERGWTQADFADVLGRPTQFVSEIVTGKKEITRESAAQLGAALETSAEFWLNLQDAYLLNEQSKNTHTQTELDNVRRRAQLNKLAPVSALLKRGIIRGRTLDEQESEIRELFGLSDLSEEPAFVLAARRSNTAEQLSAAQLTWVACVRRAARGRAADGPFRPENLAHLAERLPSSLASPHRFSDLPKKFAEVGVVLVYVEALPGAKIDGCAFFLDGTPVIGLSGRGKRLDKILFTLLHETAHLTLGHVNSDEVVIVDDEQQSGDSACEQQANDQAAVWIFPQPIPQPRERINQGWITQVALERSLAPIVIVGHLQKHERLEWRSTLARNAPTVTEELESWL